MNLFIVVLDELTFTAELEERIKSLEFVSGVYKLKDDAMLVRAYADNPKVLCEHIGMTSEGSPSLVGAIFKLNGSYHGIHQRTLWDWLAETR